MSVDRWMGAMAAGLLFAAACGGADAPSDDAAPAGSTESGADPSAAAQAEDDVDDVGSPAGAENIVDPPIELAGSSWQATNYALQESVGLTNVLGGTEVTLIFGADGSLSGLNTCNTYAASWAVQGAYFERVPTLDDDEVFGQTISITDLESTEQECPEGFESEQQADIFTNLSGAERWILSDEGKLLLNGEGVFIEAGQTG